MPSAVGENVNALYQSGAESYWSLCTQPYLRESKRGNYHPETMFGIWRHSREINLGADTFTHVCEFDNGMTHRITWEHLSYEALVVQFADDMTWIIENLNDANDAALLAESKPHNLFSQLKSALDDMTTELSQALADCDPGACTLTSSPISFLHRKPYYTDKT
jgi:hypothetical protein